MPLHALPSAAKLLPLAACMRCCIYLQRPLLKHSHALNSRRLRTAFTDVCAFLLQIGHLAAGRLSSPGLCAAAATERPGCERPAKCAGGPAWLHGQHPGNDASDNAGHQETYVKQAICGLLEAQIPAAEGMILNW